MVSRIRWRKGAVAMSAAHRFPVAATHGVLNSSEIGVDKLATLPMWRRSEFRHDATVVNGRFVTSYGGRALRATLGRFLGLVNKPAVANG